MSKPRSIEELEKKAEELFGTCDYSKEECDHLAAVGAFVMTEMLLCTRDIIAAIEKASGEHLPRARNPSEHVAPAYRITPKP